MITFSLTRSDISAGNSLSVPQYLYHCFILTDLMLAFSILCCLFEVKLVNEMKFSYLVGIQLGKQRNLCGYDLPKCCKNLSCCGDS